MTDLMTRTDETLADIETARRRARVDRDHPHYKWVALSNTTLGVLLATINSSIVLISLPAIFRGIGLNPLAPGNVSYLLWMLMGYLLASAVLVVLFGRLGDMYGRVRIYNMGFVVFTVAAVVLSFDPFHYGGGAVWLIAWRVVQGVGGAMLMANSSAILTDAFPSTQRGLALGINQVAAVAGSFLGLLIGGVLSEWDWRAIFWVGVPVGLLGTVWSYRSLVEIDQPTPGRLDWAGTVTVALGLTVLLTAITYGIQPYGNSSTGWGNPLVYGSLIAGVALLVLFCVIEARVADPMLDIRLFKNRAFGLGNLANLLASVGRGGLQFMLIIWLQGIWLPLRGYSYESTPLWAGIFLLPMTLGFLVAGPVAGLLSDRYGARPFATGGMVLSAATFLALVAIPVNFNYWVFAALIFLNGLGSAIFTAPNTAAIMSSVPAHQRGAASGVRGTFFNAGSSLSIGIFFSLMIVGLSATLPSAMQSGLTAQGVPASTAAEVSSLPPVGSLFAAFLGYNPVSELLGPSGVLDQPGVNAAELTGQTFFPNLITEPFHAGLVVVFVAAALMMAIAALASLGAGGKYAHRED
ncbi:MFS transporter [Mycobacteroides franklinii]|uniref:Antiseptic resistance protein n=1 Tax=Mycobacteroides franklinii TaxID=948102 RepID=A0A4V6QET4_9MYCO|nr:MFS transporter [Mycobacteroides franklinii]TDZ43828.1 Antiseptic resistance protein [Mycobacteroides franklinii]TDZ50963.1 Antiseptic resistance protein [Mycobacteroides franklinii]TDZ57383.1 Antiseptic resistance protein [Mycobacteroides franklinii]TDZ64324.1 Antiseptic resistance protein [Mycobacteroides franklinii]TDZ70721.1 Antiseptic resistance protein [Mycobacteroides franklinii]